MVAQLSISRAVSQPELMSRRVVGIAAIFLLAILTLPAAQSSDLELQVTPLTAIDKQYMAEQRKTVENLANRLGRRLSGRPSRDLDTLQVIVDRRWIDPADVKVQQALGVVFGDLLANELGFKWVVYRDSTGRSRALRFRDDNIFIFPVTMLSRRISAEAPLSVSLLFEEQVVKQKQKLPGARWMPSN